MIMEAALKLTDDSTAAFDLVKEHQAAVAGIDLAVVSDNEISFPNALKFELPLATLCSR